MSEGLPEMNNKEMRQDWPSPYAVCPWCSKVVSYADELPFKEALNQARIKDEEIAKTENERKRWLRQYWEKVAEKETLKEQLVAEQAEHQKQIKELGLAARKSEQLIDAINGRFGEENQLCYSCGSSSFNSEVGIIHHGDCLILELRRLEAKYLKEEPEK